MSRTKEIFGKQAISAAAGLQPRRLSFILALCPDAAQAVQNSKCLSWINTYAGNDNHARKGGVETLVILHNAGVDVSEGIDLAVSYLCEKFGVDDLLEELLATGAVTQRTKNEDCERAMKAGMPDNAAVLKRHGAKPQLSAGPKP